MDIENIRPPSLFLSVKFFCRLSALQRYVEQIPELIYDIITFSV